MTGPAEFRDRIDRARAIPIEAELARRGIVLSSERKVERFGPCPKCETGTDKFNIHTNKQVFFCRQCGCKGGGSIDLVMWLDHCDFITAVKTLNGAPPPRAAPRVAEQSGAKDSAEQHERRQHEKASWLWGQRRPIVGTIAERYLREARGYNGPLPRSLAFLPPTKPEHHPTMIAAFAVCDEPEPGIVGEPRDVEAVHLTFLKRDGSGKADAKPNKIVIGRPLGRPIIIAPPNDLMGLVVAEGIEDGLSTHESTGLGVWVAGSAGFMPSLADSIPDYITCIQILVDSDPAGRRFSTALAKRLRALKVRPPERKPRLLFVRDDRPLEFYPAERPTKVILRELR